MSTSYTANLRLGEPALDDTGWGLVLNANLSALDAQAPIGGLATVITETPSATLGVQVAAGAFISSTGVVVNYAGSTQTMTASATNYIYLTDAGALVVNTTGFPSSSTLSVPLAKVVTGTATITSVTDSRITCNSVGTAAFLPLAGGTLTDGANIVLGTTTGTKIATATTQKLGFWAATPVVQPSGAAQAALTSAAGTASTTVADVGASFSQATLNNNFASTLNLLNAIRSALVAAGLMKGSA